MKTFSHLEKVIMLTKAVDDLGLSQYNHLDSDLTMLIFNIAQQAYEYGRYNKHTELVLVRDIFETWRKNCNCTCNDCQRLAKIFCPLFDEIELNHD